MLPESDALSFSFFDANGGDALWIRFFGEDKQWHNILIDGGFGNTYKYVFGPLIHDILTAGERVDAWIITHIDRDHIGAVLAFTRDKKIGDKKNAVKEFWFNHSGMKIKESNGKLSVADGVELKTFLRKNGLLAKEAIITSSTPINCYGLEITILSPTAEKLKEANKLWQKKERGGKLGRTAAQADHYQKIEQLVQHIYTGDTDPVNASSIACLVAFHGKTALLLGDSQPEIIASSLTSLGYGNNAPLHLDFVQLAHHGSKANTSPELLDLIKCSKFVITGNGITNRHPDKETLARILTHKRRQDGHLAFIFPCRTNELTGLFSIDADPYKRYNFSCHFGDARANAVTLSFCTSHEKCP